MIFHKSLVEELRGVAGVVFATLLTIVVTSTLIRTLGRAASGKADAELLLPLIALSTVSALTLVISLTAFMSVLLVLSRMWKESEMVVWLASGQSLRRFIRPIWSFLWPIVLLISFVSLFLAPWAREQSEALKQGFESREEARRVAPGQFGESQTGKRVFFVENPESDSAELGMVFVVTREPDGRETVLMASRGRFRTDDEGQPWVTIRDGTRTDLPAWQVAGQRAIRTMTFQSYELEVDSSPGGASIESSVRAQSLVSLLLQLGPQQFGEIAFRIGTPMVCLLLGLLAIPLSVVNPRMGRSFHLLVAFLITMTANNLLSVTQAWIAQGRVSFAMGWWPLPLALTLLFVALMWFRSGLRRGPLEMVWLGIRRLRSQS